MIRKFVVAFGTLGLIAAFVAVIGVLFAGRPQPQQGEPVSFDPVVFVEEVEFGPHQVEVFAQGEVSPKQQITLTPQVSGLIVMVSPSFAAGGVIRRGETLIRLEDADYRLAVTRAEAQVASALQALEIERAESALALQDYRELSGGTLQGDPSDLTLRLPQLQRAEADFKAAQASLADAELALSRTQITAPFSGRVRSINANIGQFVSTGFQLGTIFSTDVAEIRLPLTDSDLAQLDLPLAFNDKTRGPIVRLSNVAAGRERSWVGRVVRTDAAVDTSTRQISAIAEVEDPYGSGADNGFPLAIGLYVDARIEGPMLPSATILPRTALQRDNIVYTVNEQNRVVENVVEVAASTQDGVIITAGLDAGDKVVVSRLPSSVGSKVRPLTSDEKRDTPPSAETANDNIEGENLDTALAGESSNDAPASLSGGVQ